MLKKIAHMMGLRNETLKIEGDVLVLRRGGTTEDSSLDAIERVEYLQSFIEAKYPLIASQKGFNKIFKQKQIQHHWRCTRFISLN